MECLHDTQFLKFHHDTLEVVRKEFGLDKPGILEQSLDILEAWLQKQEHFVKKDFSRKYLEITLVSCKGSVEKSKLKLDKLCTLKNLLPQYFERSDKSEMDVYDGLLAHSFLPNMTPTHERIYFGRNSGFKTSNMMVLYKNIIKFFEYLKAHEYALGFVIILDFSTVNLLEFLPKLNPSDIRNAISIMLDGFGFRLKGIHIVSSSKMVDALVTLFKQVLSAKLGERIYVHKTFDTLYDVFPRDIMPKDYGGSAKSLMELHDEFQDYLSSAEFGNYLEEMSKARVDEALRSTIKFNEQYMGMPGSFKVLSVD